MIRISFTESDLERPRYERFHHPHPRVQRKVEAVPLKSAGMKHEDICGLTGICGNTLRSCPRDYADGGVERLKEVHFCRRESEPERHRGTIEEYFREHPPTDMKEATAAAERITGIGRGENRVRVYPKSIGMKRRKVGMIPAEADPYERDRFRAGGAESPSERGGRRAARCFSVDAAHSVPTPFPGFMRSFSGFFIRAPSGRKRFNVPGALNAVTHELITVRDETYINAESVRGLLYKISESCVGIPVTLVPDDARYRKCRVVFEPADLLDTELLYIPPYSPNPNLIGRLWKSVKKRCPRSKYCAGFEEFKTAINDCPRKTHTTYGDELRTLLTPKFQTFDKVQIDTV